MIIFVVKLRFYHSDYYYSIKPQLGSVRKIFYQIKNLGVVPAMPAAAKQKRQLFNTMNFFTFVMSLILNGFVIISNPNYDKLTLFIGLCASLSSVILASLMSLGRFRFALIFSMVIFTLLAVTLSWLTGNAIINSFIFCLVILATYVVTSTRFLQYVFVFCWAGFTVGSLLAYQNSMQNVVSIIFYSTCAFTLMYLALTTIKKKMLEYQKHIQIINKRQLVQNKKIEEQNVKLLKQKLDLEDKNRALSDLNKIKTSLFTVVSHDLKQYVYNLSTTILLTEKHQNNFELLKEVLPQLKEDTNHTRDLLNTLMQWSKSLLVSADAVPCEILVDEFIASVVKENIHVARQKNIELQVGSIDAAYACADENMMRIVLRNVLTNACKFTETGGIITICAKSSESEVDIIINDTGVGMKSESLKLFQTGEEFSTLGTKDEQGNGLGLLLCRELLGRNKGRLKIESTPGVGTTVTLTLPAITWQENRMIG